MTELPTRSQQLADVSTAELEAELECRRDEDELSVLIRDLARCAGVAYPSLVADWRELNRENENLRRRCAMAEASLDRMVTIAAREALGLEPETGDEGS